MASLSSNEPTNVENSEEELSKQDKATLRLVKSLFNQLEKERRPISDHWDDYERFYEGQQYRNNNINNFNDEPARQGPDIRVPFNIIRQTIQTQLPIMTDLSPSFEALPREPSDFIIADMINDITDYWWERYGLQNSIVEVYTDEMVFSAGIAKVTWNPDLEDGLGDAQVKILNPRDIWVNFEASDFGFDKNCRIACERIRKTVGEWKRLFPDKAKFIRTDTTKEEMETKSRTTSKGIQSPVDQVPLFDQTKNTQHPDGQIAEALEFWLTDESMIEVVLEKKDKNGVLTGEKEKQLRKKFPNGRHIIVLHKQNLVLLDEDNPFEDGEFPYVRFVDTIRSRKFWGEGECEPLMEMQKLINKMANSIANNINMMGNPYWTNPSESGIENDEFTNSIGGVYTFDGPNKPEMNFPTTMSPDYFTFYEQLIRFSESITGTQEISQGRRPVGVTSGDAIETLQEASQTRIRLKDRNNETSLKRLGRLVISRFMQFYREPRVFRITGKQGWPEFFEFFIQETEEGLVFNKKKITPRFNEDTGRPEDFVPEPEPFASEPSKGVFDITVTSGTSLPFQKEKRESRAFKLFEQGVISKLELLETLEHPNPQQTIKEREEEQRQEAELQQQLQPPPIPGAPA